MKSKKNIIRMIVAVVAAFCLAACTESVDNAEKVDR